MLALALRRRVPGRPRRPRTRSPSRSRTSGSPSPPGWPGTLDAGLYWTVNDSGASGVAYAISPTARSGQPELLARSRRTSRRSRCTTTGSISADIGDNDEQRDFVRSTSSTIPRANGLTVDYRALRLPLSRRSARRRDAAGQRQGPAVHRDQGRPGRDLRRAQKPSRTASTTCSRVGSAPALVTDGTFLPGGEQDRPAQLRLGRVIDAQHLPERGQCRDPEAAAGRVDDGQPRRRIAAGGQRGQESKVYAIAVPGTPTATPSPDAHAVGRPAPDPTRATCPTRTTDAQCRPEQAGTLLAVGLAGFVAVVAGVVVALVRKP